jgi:hypothetical protein
MARYYFHARGPNRRVPDGKGIDLDSIQAAHDLAIQIVRDITGGRHGFPTASAWTIEIADHNRQLILTMPFVDAFKMPQVGGHESVAGGTIAAITSPLLVAFPHPTDG